MMLNEMLLKANAVFQGLKDVLKPGIRQISPYGDYEADELFYSYNPVTLKREGDRHGR
ncbi:hypothetical protein [Eubacterium aggregans]|uniref:hypothetical protein n=1 Tax=Eubacterium aggregans TaxID=81409 RepID=UPI003F2C12BB